MAFSILSSDANRIAAAVATASLIVLVWWITDTALESGAPPESAPAAEAAHADERSQAGMPAAADYFPAQFKAPEGEPADPIATF